MTIMMLRRRKLGMGSVRGIAHHSEGAIDWVRNDNLNSKNWNNITHVVRWGCTSSLPTGFTHIPIINKSGAIHATSNKSSFRKTFQMAYPQWSIPSFGSDWGTPDFPCIARPHTHSRGLNLTLCNNPNSLLDAARSFGTGWYAGKFIPKIEEYRVYVVGGRSVAVAKKVVEDKTAIAWNRARGDCEFVNVRWDEWPLSVVEAGIAAVNHLELDFGGADVMIDSDGRPYVLEVNSAPSLPLHEKTNTFRINSTEDIAARATYRQKCFTNGLLHTIEHGHMAVGDVSGWRDVIHPGVNHNARIV